MVLSSRSAGIYRWLLGDGPAQWVPVLAGVGVLEIEQVVVQVDDRIPAPARRERVNGDELAQSQGGGKGPEVGGAMRSERRVAKAGSGVDLVPVGPIRT
jgi:hypothetical protein